MNRKSSLFFISDISKSKTVNLTEKLFTSFQAKFNEAFTKLAFIGVEHQFLSHTSNYHLFEMSWPPEDERKMVLGPVARVEGESFPGLYGGHEVFCHFGYLLDSSLFIV